MATSESIEQVNSTDVVQVNAEVAQPTKDRDISTLYAMDSYQDMTDSEIEKLMLFKISLAETRAATEVQKKVYEETRERIFKSCEERREMTKNSLDQIRNSFPTYVSSTCKTVETKKVSSDSEEV